MLREPLAYVTHHVDGSQACCRLAPLLGVTEGLIVECLLGGEERCVHQVSHQDGVDGAEETADLRGQRVKSDPQTPFTFWNLEFKETDNVTASFSQGNPPFLHGKCTEFSEFAVIYSSQMS